MPDYGLTQDFLAVTNAGIIAIPSGSKTDDTTAISASIPQVLAVTCSSNFNNRLTKLTTLNAFGIITLTSGSGNFNDNRLVLRYINSASLSNQTGSELAFTGSTLNDTIVDIPINNNDDSFLVAYRTVEALNNLPTFNAAFKASLVDDGSSLASVSSSLGRNMSIGSTFKIRNSASLGTTSLTDGGEGKFTITSLNSGALALPDFSGTQVQVGGMMVGSSFKVGGSPDTFNFNIITTGSGKMNQSFFPGRLFLVSASLIQRMDPQDKKSFEFLVPSQSVGGSDDLIPFYVSSSRKVGFLTKDPITEIDFRADEFQIRKQVEDRGLKVNDEGNIESFDNTAETSATGSEFILRYSRGVTVNESFINTLFGSDTVSSDEEAQTFFTDKKPDEQASLLEKGADLGLINPPAAGDIIGSVRFITDSGSSTAFNDRTTGEAAAIQAVVHSADSTGVRGDLVFKVADQTGTSVQRMVLDAGDDHEITGSLEIGGTTATAGSIKVAGSTGNLMGGIFRFGASSADQKIGRMLVHDDGVIKASISAKGKSFINGTSGTGTTGTFFGINTDDPSAALHIVGDALITGKLTVTSITSSMITSSILVTSGSNIFGDDNSDSHLFRGAITASSNISASGEVSANTIVVGSTITRAGDSNTKITFSNDDINLTAAGKTAIDITYDGDGGGDTREITFNEGHADIDVRIEGDTDANLFFTDAGNEKVGIGTNSPGEKLEVVGNISASGTITALSSNIVTIDGGSF